MASLSQRRRQLVGDGPATPFAWVSAVRRRRGNRLLRDENRRVDDSPPRTSSWRRRPPAWCGMALGLGIVLVLAWWASMLPTIDASCEKSGIVMKCDGVGPGIQTPDLEVEIVMLEGRLWAPTPDSLQHLWPNFQEIRCRPFGQSCNREMVFSHQCLCLGHPISDLNAHLMVQSIKKMDSRPFMGSTHDQGLLQGEFQEPVTLSPDPGLQSPKVPDLPSSKKIPDPVVPEKESSDSTERLFKTPSWLGPMEVLLILAIVIVVAIGVCCYVVCCCLFPFGSTIRRRRRGQFRQFGGSRELPTNCRPSSLTPASPDPVPQPTGPIAAGIEPEMLRQPRVDDRRKPQVASNFEPVPQLESSTPYHAGRNAPFMSDLDLSRIDRPDNSPRTRPLLARPRSVSRTFVKPSPALARIPVAGQTKRLAFMAEEATLGLDARSLISGSDVSISHGDFQNQFPDETVGVVIPALMSNGESVQNGEPAPRGPLLLDAATSMGLMKSISKGKTGLWSVSAEELTRGLPPADGSKGRNSPAALSTGTGDVAGLRKGGIFLHSTALIPSAPFATTTSFNIEKPPEVTEDLPKICKKPPKAKSRPRAPTRKRPYPSLSFFRTRDKADGTSGSPRGADSRLDA